MPSLRHKSLRQACGAVQHPGARSCAKERLAVSQIIERASPRLVDPEGDVLSAKERAHSGADGSSLRGARARCSSPLCHGSRLRRSTSLGDEAALQSARRPRSWPADSRGHLVGSCSGTGAAEKHAAPSADSSEPAAGREPFMGIASGIPASASLRRPSIRMRIYYADRRDDGGCASCTSATGGGRAPPERLCLLLGLCRSRVIYAPPPAAARPATRPEKMQPPRNVPSSAR